jgi:hypothetical protein
MVCLKILGLLTLGLAIGFGFIWHKLNEPPELPEIPDTYWGPGNSKPDDTSIKSFTINYPDSVSVQFSNRSLIIQPKIPNPNFTSY